MAVISKGEVFSSSDNLREIWPVSSAVAQGTALLDAAERPGVAYTGSGGATRSETTGPYTVSGIPAGGQGLSATQVSVATDGTWEFEVTGASDSTPQGTIVYAVVAAGEITGLTLTASTNKKFGVVNYPSGYVVDGTVVPVKIGVKGI